MPFVTPDFAPALAEITLLGVLCAVLVADLFVSDERRVITYWLSIAALGVTLIAVVAAQPLSRELSFSGSFVNSSLQPRCALRSCSCTRATT